MTLAEFETTLNDWGQNNVPFLFIVDFEMKMPIAVPLERAASERIFFYINGRTNALSKKRSEIPARLKIIPLPLPDYRKKFQVVNSHLERGNSFLTNLTIRSEIETALTLEEIFSLSAAKYKLLYKDRFLVFSPEIFVQIRDGFVFSYPMKGTINAQIPDAETKILSDEKETAEHVTIVDLIRNDLSMVSGSVKVTRFRYIDRIETDSKTLLQVSSEIVGDLNAELAGKFGTILLNLLPAGSVSGAPKPMTLRIISEAEGIKRGYYTGVFGIYDGKVFDSGVMIRFIERSDDRLYYRSGGGITTQSICEHEYQEALDKIYVPLT